MQDNFFSIFGVYVIYLAFDYGTFLSLNIAFFVHLPIKQIHEVYLFGNWFLIMWVSTLNMCWDHS